ncbi:ATP-grasp ribosomal peptide maturase [Streptomyces griseoaurantiacus]|uniref:ATP-grasp ribosomal peptide maturase n=1 Tax=Streptomyces griseoaurantiacus TaxID=68213 RepID=UPI0034615A6A
MAPTVLVITALEDVTADMVVAALNERGTSVVRVDPAGIGSDLFFRAGIGQDSMVWGGRLRTASREVELEEVTAVYYRRPTPYAAGYQHLPQQPREFATAEARHGLGGVLNNLYGVLYVNDPAAVTRADFKPAQLQRFVELGLRIPPTLVTNEVQAAKEFAAKHEHVIYKPFRGLPRSEDGYTGAIWAQRVDPGTFDSDIAVTAHLFQAEIAKVGDVRVTVVGRRAFAQRITTRDGVLDWRRGNWDELIHAPIAVPKPVEAALHSYLVSFGLVFGCFDFALTGNGDAAEDWTAIECNPNGQWGWLPDASAITGTFADILSGREAAGYGESRRL